MVQEYPWDILTHTNWSAGGKTLALKYYYVDKKMHWKTRTVLKNSYLSVSMECTVSCTVWYWKTHHKFDVRRNKRWWCL